MIVYPAAVLGAIWGALVARRRKGNRLDMAQYAVGYGIATGLAALLATYLIGTFL